MPEIVINNDLSIKQRANLVWKLSIPAILAQITSIIMQYIDAGMVGKLGASQSASIGLMSTTTWLIGGLCSSASTGFSVQVAQYIGAKDIKRAKGTCVKGLISTSVFAIILAFIGVILSFFLPGWLGGGEEICRDASIYFLIYCISLPVIQLNSIAGGMLQCSGNMKVPSFLNGLMCVLDVIFNALLIFPASSYEVEGMSVRLPGIGLGVMGAALGTALSQVVIMCIMLWFLCVKSALKFDKSIKNTECSGIIKRAIKIATPVAFEHTALCGAMIVTTKIVAPLGTIAIAANSFAITAESLCYMPGYGIAAAATTLVGQSFGAGYMKMSKKLAWMCVAFGVGIMAVTGAVMYYICPWMMMFLTPDEQVRELGTQILRIEMFAEPLFGASIVASGALRGAGDTFIPSILNLISIWGVRISLSLLLVGSYGLKGVWFGMCVELCFRGIILLIRLIKEKA